MLLTSINWGLRHILGDVSNHFYVLNLYNLFKYLIIFQAEFSSLISMFIVLIFLQ